MAEIERWPAYSDGRYRTGSTITVLTATQYKNNCYKDGTKYRNLCFKLFI